MERGSGRPPGELMLQLRLLELALQLRVLVLGVRELALQLRVLVLQVLAPELLLQEPLMLTGHQG